MAASSRYMETHFLVSVIQNRHHQYSTRTFSWVFLLLIVQKLSTKGQYSLYSSVDKVKGDSIINSHFRVAWMSAGALITAQGVEECHCTRGRHFNHMVVKGSVANRKLNRKQEKQLQVLPMKVTADSNENSCLMG